MKTINKPMRDEKKLFLIIVLLRFKQTFYLDWSWYVWLWFVNVIWHDQASGFGMIDFALHTTVSKGTEGLMAPFTLVVLKTKADSKGLSLSLRG